MKRSLKVKALDYHRNGISGLGFHVALVEQIEDGEMRTMVVVRFPKRADEDTGAVVCAAFDVAKLAAGDIAFMSNSWRGDHYHETVDAAIAKVERDR